MEEMGMTDMQFKSFLKQLIRNLEKVKEAESSKAKDNIVDAIVKDLKTDLEN